jgi:eukaryotic-like serine/threonine-protein kinase
MADNLRENHKTDLSNNEIDDSIENREEPRLQRKRKNKSNLSKKAKAVFLVALVLLGFFVIGFVGTNAVMSVVVGRGAEVVVPDIRGLSFDVARKMCIDLNLFVQQVDVRHDDEIEANRVISQTPEPDKKTKINRTIEVVVSKGPELVRVPYLDSISEMEAKIRLENMGLNLGEKIYRYSAEVERDRIILSQPMADEFVPKGSSVSIVLSLGELPDATQRRDRYRDILDRVE